MPHYLKMIEDAYGSPNGRTVYRYLAGVVYHAASVPPVDAFLANSFVSSGRAVACDAEGNPVAAVAAPSTTTGKNGKPGKTAVPTASDTSDAPASTAVTALETALEQVIERTQEEAATATSTATADAPKG